MSNLKIIPNNQWRVVYNDNEVIQFTNIGETHTTQNVFLGTKYECKDFIINNNLKIWEEL